MAAKTSITRAPKGAATAQADGRNLNAAMYCSIASNKFGELAELFDVIRKEVDERSRLFRLANLGYDVARDYENQADCWREDMEGGAA